MFLNEKKLKKEQFDLTLYFTEIFIRIEKIKLLKRPINRIIRDNIDLFIYMGAILIVYKLTISKN